MTEIRIDDEGLLAADPADFEEAVELVRTRELRGLWIRPDSLGARADAPRVELSRLRTLPSLRNFGIAEGVALERLVDFAAIGSLHQLEKLAIYTFQELDLAAFPRLEILMIRDSPGLVGLARMTRLRQVRITGLRSPDLSVLAGNTELTELMLIRAKPEALVGLDRLTALVDLQLSHCSKLRALLPLPPALRALRIMSCGRLGSLEFLRGNPTLERLYASALDTLSFVPELPRLGYLGFEKLGDGDLSPVLASTSLRDVGFAPRKHYSHRPEALKVALADRHRGSSDA
jgi:hypothetical protein